jgi:quercetin dioxygenase-like cupin family protein
MIIIVKGKGRSIGDSQVSFEGGAVLHIPAYNSHGFVGGPGGFWALSVQFQETAIFESQRDPLTKYADATHSFVAEPIEVIHRGDLDSISHAEVGDEIHELGDVRNFGSHPTMRAFLPEDLSLAWVRLARGQELKVHRHPEDSMIIVTEGEGSALGEVNGYIKEGDIVYVPEGHAHGFAGEGAGFWALSIQFANASLYEDVSTPRVTFDPPACPFEELQSLNDRLSERFNQHRVFDLIRLDLLQDPKRRQRFLAGLQVWSEYFQRVVLSRAAFVRNGAFRDVFYAHLLEEIGHDKDLQSTHDGELDFDAALEGMGSWFVVQSLSLDNVDRIVMINMVLERAGSVFYTQYSKYLRSFDISAHFEDHSEHDDEHEKMGLELFDNLHPAQFDNLEAVMRDSWDMISAILDRIVEITLAE